MLHRFYFILLVVSSLAVAGHFALMTAMPSDHGEHGRHEEAGAMSCPIGVVCLSALGNVSDMPIAASMFILLAVLAWTIGAVVRDVRPYRLVPIHIRTGTRFPELLSVFKRE